MTKGDDEEGRGERLRKDAEHLDRLTTLGELAATLAHELSQPLTAIVSDAQAALRFLNREEPELGEVKAALEDILAASKRAHDVIVNVRSLSRFQTPGRERIAINDLVSDIVRLLQSETVFRNVSVEVELADALPYVTGDRVQLRQVMLNLLMNAMEALDSNPVATRQIRVSTRLAGSHVVVAVADRGPGIESKHLDAIFEPFFTTKGKGLGLGLSISRSIISEHAGALTVESRHGEGATFAFMLPAAADS